MGRDNEITCNDKAAQTSNTSVEDNDSSPDHEEYHELIVDGTLDLHMFSPKDIKYLIPDYLEECREKGILSIRIIHGKGTGALRRTVHSILGRLSWVESFSLSSEWEGGWGATIVILSPPQENDPPNG